MSAANLGEVAHRNVSGFEVAEVAEVAEGALRSTRRTFRIQTLGYTRRSIASQTLYCECLDSGVSSDDAENALDWTREAALSELEDVEKAAEAERAERAERAELFEDEQTVRDQVLRRLADVDRIVVVMSGKGGVGKTSVSVNLAIALAQLGRRVGLFDADLNGPSVAKMLGLRGQPVRVSGSGDLGAVPGPLGLKVQSMDFFLQGNQALDWDGPQGEGAAIRSGLEQSATADLLGRTDWGALDVLVIDLAPGADRLPALSRFLPAKAAALAVTIPSQVALLSVDRSLRRARELRFPLIGLVENMGTSICSKCGAEEPLFRDTLDGENDSGAGSDFGLQIDVIARIPFDRKLATEADAGRLFLEGRGRGSVAGQAFAELAAKVDAYAQPDPQGESW